MSRRALLLIFLLAMAGPSTAAERTQSFDVDPGWDAHHNRTMAVPERTVAQRFGYSATQHAGGKAAGEIGGQINPAAEAAYYAKTIAPATFGDKLSASGTLACPGQTPFHALIGFFNADTLNEWRTPNSLAIRIHGRGDKFFAYVEYATSRWRAGGDSPGGFATDVDPKTGKPQLRGFKTDGQVHHWTLTYDPAAHDGGGSITVTIDDETSICHLDRDHKLDGATFNRFGLLPVMKQWDNPGEVWLDDVTVNGELHTFNADPRWDAKNNQRTYVTTNVRPRFDFGYSPTHFAGGKATGELGGLVFRGDIRYPERMAYYGDRLQRVTLDRPLRAAGTITLRRAVSDSTVLLGFFHSQQSVQTADRQDTGFPQNFAGLAVEGPSRAGFFVYPALHTADGVTAHAPGDDRPTILPDGSVHRWTLENTPRAETGGGRLAVTLDGRRSELDYTPHDKSRPTVFDRFGLLTTWIDGNGQQIYFDDLTYTVSQD